MKGKMFIAALIMFGSIQTLFAYNAALEIAINSREILVTANYTIAENDLKIEMPARSRILGLTILSGSGIENSQVNQTTFITKTPESGESQFVLKYSISINNVDFYMTDWLPKLPSGGQISVKINKPEGYTVFFAPYTTRTQDEYTLTPSDNPVLICGRYTTECITNAGSIFEIYFRNKSGLPITNIAAIYRAYESLFYSMNKERTVFVMLPNLIDTTIKTSNSIFIMLQNTMPFEIKRAISSLWFGKASTANKDAFLSLTDYYRRLVSDTGALYEDDAIMIPVPSRSYYQQHIQTGFTTPVLINCETETMLKNFAFLHLSYYTLGIGQMTGLIRSAIATQSVSNQWSSILSGVTVNKEASMYIADRLLPIATTIPDVGFKENNAFRSDLSIPSVNLTSGATNKKLDWANNKIVNLKNLTEAVTIDSERIIPQLDFANDSYQVDRQLITERDKVAYFITRQKKFPNETIRQVLNLELFIAPAVNAYKLTDGQHIYLAVVKITGTIDGRLRTALKEQFVSVSPDELKVVYERIRY